MFISGAVMATLFFGGYDIPFVNEASWGLSPNAFGDHWICCIACQSIFLFVCIYVDTMDDSTFPLRSVDEPGMEEINSAGIDQYDRYGGGDVVEGLTNSPKEGEWHGTKPAYLKWLIAPKEQNTSRSSSNVQPVEENK